MTDDAILFKKMVTHGLYYPEGTTTQAFMCNTIVAHLGSWNDARHAHLQSINDFMAQLQQGTNGYSNTLYNSLHRYVGKVRNKDHYALEHDRDLLNQTLIDIYSDWDNRWVHVEALVAKHKKLFP